MVEMKELSAFQRNMNSLTLYLYLMNSMSKHLADYDDEGEFETHNCFFNLTRTKLKDKIDGDSNLLINQPLFKTFFEKKDKEKKDERKKIKIKEEDRDFLYKTYFDYSNTLSKSKLRNKSYNWIAWSIVAIVFLALVILPHIFLHIKPSLKTIFKTLFENLELCAIFFCSFIISLSFLIRGLTLKSVVNKKVISKTKFKLMYSDDYCFRRIKESEAFFRTHYNVENDILELTEIERQFPEKDNLFYKTIMETKTLTERNKIKLLTYNDNIFCRAVFSELFNYVKDEGVQKGNLQQIPFVFKACQIKTKIKDGNTGFAECINHLLDKSVYVDVTFNQAMTKLTDPESEICPKYLELIKKYENI